MTERELEQQVQEYLAMRCLSIKEMPLTRGDLILWKNEKEYERAYALYVSFDKRKVSYVGRQPNPRFEKRLKDGAPESWEILIHGLNSYTQEYWQQTEEGETFCAPAEYNEQGELVEIFALLIDKEKRDYYRGISQRTENGELTGTYIVDENYMCDERGHCAPTTGFASVEFEEQQDSFKVIFRRENEDKEIYSVTVPKRSLTAEKKLQEVLAEFKDFSFMKLFLS